MKINTVYNAVNQKAAFKVMFISSTAYSAKKQQFSLDTLLSDSHSRLIMMFMTLTNMTVL